MREQLEEKDKTINQFRILLLEKDEEIAQMMERKSLENHERSFFRKKNNDLEGKCDVLSHHRRQKWQQCLRLETLNLSLQEENIHLLQENRFLHAQLCQLKDYVLRMEEDLACNNIKSPRILSERGGERTFR